MTELLNENFKGRICTILTNPVSFPFKDAIQHSQFFTGKVERIDKFGIWLRHMQTNTIAFYAFPIVGIVEEQVVSQNDPRIEKLKTEIKKQELPPNSQFIPIESLTKIIKNQ